MQDVLGDRVSVRLVERLRAGISGHDCDLDGVESMVTDDALGGS